MHISKLLAISCVVAASAAPAFAASSMNSDAMGSMMSGSMMGTMKTGETFAFMPNGQMGKAMMTKKDSKMAASMMKMATPLKGCVMFMTGAHGKTYMIDTSSKAAMALCEKIAK